MTLYYAFNFISQFDASDNTDIYKTVIVQKVAPSHAVALYSFKN